MDQELIELIETQKKKAKASAKKPPRTSGTPSLSQIIKTKEQADRFMRLLKLAGRNEL